MSDSLTVLRHTCLTDLETLASSTASKNGYELCSVNLFTHINPMTIQILIRQKSGGDVSLEDCATFNGPMGEALDNSDLLKDPYVLEISSEGIGENLQNDRDFITFHGFPIEVSFFSQNGSKLNQSGLLHKRSESHVLLNIKGRIKQIPRADVICVRLTSPTS